MTAANQADLFGQRRNAVRSDWGPVGARTIGADVAEIVSFDDLMATGSMQNAKEYVMVDGDVVEFRVNV